jgi:hypothetical protein
MATITTRAGKGSPLTNAELDDNFTGINDQVISYKKPVRAATTANITLSGTQTIDGVVLVVGDRVLVKNQSSASANGIYVVAASAWSMASDADSSSEIAASVVSVLSGTANGGEFWTTTFKSTDTLATTAMNWYEVVFNTGTWAISTTGSAATLTTARTIQTNLGSTSTASFNGSANITPGVTGTLVVGNGGTGVQTLTGIVKGNGSSAFSAATAGTDYLAPAAIGVTVQEYDVDTAKLDVAQIFTAQQTFKEVKDTVHTITDGAGFQIDPANGSIQVVTLGADRTPAATNFEAGQVVLLGVDDGSNYNITWTTVNPTWVKVGGTGAAPNLADSGFTWILLWKVGTTIYATEVGSP